MEGALIILAVTVITGVILYLFDRRGRKNQESTPVSQDETVGEDETVSRESAPASLSDNSAKEESSECCGLHLVCEKELDAIANDRILYYDDEELDRFIGRTPDDYSNPEVEEFRDVLLTLLPTDIPGWARSLDRRNIQPPRQIREELLLMLSEL